MMAPNSLSEGRSINILEEVKAWTRRYLIMMDFDPFSSLKVVYKWTYPIVSVVSNAKSYELLWERLDLAFGNGQFLKDKPI